jgi:hypothetical protein
MLIGKRISRGVRLVIKGLPLVAIFGASLLPLSQRASQFLMLITLLWLQVFIISECYLVDR